ncbi:MAG: S9 family peptidase [Lutibacter sp.]|uniref:S9 family peptidase n=1 Tax=Lutibacter sp. TaxID=1925666 RepID=UPI00179EA086|nr:S9 family peptidase [Lutibacter sp.]MBT8316941.1 S9 family peptidase [Lutibacter sp.]NNJ57801.1 S9 family peptidase [Lutibacter sp.]
MKKILIFFIAITSLASAQKKTIALEEIWNGTFRTERMNSLNSMNGDFYTLQNFNRETGSTTVDKFSYATLEKVETIVDSKDLEDLKYFESYSFNNNETKLILGVDTEPIYRRSSLGIFYVYDIASKSLKLIDEDKIQEPTFSPDSKKVAYAKDNNLFIKNLETNEVIQITNDGLKNNIINGICDWVYEEEFGFVKAFEWSNDSSTIAFLRFDESEVPTYSMDITGKELYPTQQVFKYPKAGEKNAVVTLHLFNVDKKSTSKINLGDYEYIPRIKWTNDANILCATTLNRHQNNLNLYFVNATDASAKIVLNETDKAYVDIQDNLTFLEDNSFIWTSENDGFNHIYYYDEQGNLKNQITKGNWEVTKFYGVNEKTKTIYYQSVEDGSINRTIYSIKLNGKNKKRLTNASGTNSASFSKNFAYFINTFSDANTPPIYTLHNGNGKLLKEVLNNNKLSKQLEGYKLAKKEFFTLKTTTGDFNAWMLKPTNFDANKEYPLFMTQYSGPGSQSVSNSWNGSNDYWYQHLANEGYIIVCVDGRGTGLKGAEFKKVTYKELGKYEVIDQIESAKELGKRSYINQNEIGIWGWSYGGFMSSNCLLKGNDVFKMAIAVAPVTSWRFYDSIYTERYMQTPQENPSGYDENSPLNYADLLKGKYLLVHGSGDDNVHVQNTMRFSNALIEANKPFDHAVYPDRTHGIYRGKNTRLHLYNKMTSFIKENLGEQTSTIELLKQ